MNLFLCVALKIIIYLYKKMDKLMSFFLYGRPRFYYQIVYEYGGEIIFEKKNPLYIMELLPDNKKVDAGLLLN